MHQTTVRFGPDLWEALEVECSRMGVSAAQYIRESTLARLSYAGGRVGVPSYEMALASAGGEPAEAGKFAEPRFTPEETRRHAQLVAEATDLSEAMVLDSSALGAQSRLARKRARDLRSESANLRARSHSL